MLCVQQSKHGTAAPGNSLLPWKWPVLVRVAIMIQGFKPCHHACCYADSQAKLQGVEQKTLALPDVDAAYSSCHNQ